MKEDEGFLFERLDVYQRSLSLSIEICKIITKLPYKYHRICDQLVGAVTSIPLNIAEGNGRFTSKEKVSFYKIARGSCFECIPLFAILHALDLIEDKSVDNWRFQIKDIYKMLSGLIRYQSSK